ncbi:MAG TPA: 23S rRNA (guanosine(2251)-2'-O)-methyltransferase RlmB [Candidatus Binatia bacterium]
MKKQRQPMSDNENSVFGVNPVLEKLRASAKDILEILISESSDRGALRQISQEAARLKLRVTAVPRAVLDRLAGGQRHQGVVAKIEAYRYLPFEALLEKISGSLNSEWILILDSLTDPRNFGALLRAAEAVGIRYIIIPKDRSVQVTPLVVKASAGAVYHVNVIKATNLRRVILELKRRGFWIVGLNEASQECVYDKTFPSRLAIILGSEGKGVRPVNLQECDFLVSIPMLGKVESLNVAVAGAVFLYELFRQKRNLDHQST